MSAYNPPTEDIPTFNSSLFNQPEETLSQAQADLLYLSKKTSDTSTAPLTTFNNQISVGGAANFNSSVSLRNRYKIFDYLNITSDTTITLSIPLSQSYVIRTTSVGTTALTITLPAIDGNDVGRIINFVKFKGTTNLAVTLNCGAFNIIPLNEIATLGGLTNTSLLSVDKQMTSLMISLIPPSSYFYLEVNNYSTFDRDYNNSIYPRLTAANSFSNRLNFSAASYSFPFASSQSLGYYLKATGTAETITSVNYFTILTTASIPIGVWRIDFSVTNQVGSSGAGTITEAQSFVSATLNGGILTAVPFTGSSIQSHVNEIYANNDVQVINNSFTFQQTTAGPLYLTITRTFVTGTYLFTGEVAVTRLA